MDLLIKSLSGTLEEDEKKLIRKKMLWFEDHLPNNAQMTIGVRQNITKKSNQAFEVIVHLSWPKIKKPVYVRLVDVKLGDVMDKTKTKIERIVLKKKEKRQFKFKIPRLKFRKSNENS